MAFVLRPPQESESLNQLIRGMGRNRRTVHLAIGSFVFLSVVGLTALAWIWLDVAFHFSGGLRGLGLLSLLLTGGVLLLRGILSPAKMSIAPIDMAQLIESQHPEFNDALASAISFQEQSEHPASRSPFRHAAIQRAERLTNRIELSHVIPNGLLIRSITAATLVTILLFATVLAEPTRTRIATIRLFDPFGSHPWPPRTTLEILEPTRSIHLIAKGAEFQVQFELQGEIPAEAQLQVRMAGSSGQSKSIPLESDESSRAIVNHRIPPDQITRDFDYRVSANDADSGWISITVADPPRLTLLHGRPSPQIRLTYRDYSEEPATQLSDGAGAIEALGGTKIELRAATDRPIVSAHLHYEGDRGAMQMANALGHLAIGHPLSVGAYPTLASEFLADRVVEVHGPNRSELFIEFETLVSGLYSLSFTDELGLTGEKKLDLRSFADPKPVVTLLRPSPTIDSLELVPDATLTLQARADDRTFALRDLALEYRFNDQPFQTLSRVDARPAEWALPGVAGSIALSTHRRPNELEIRQTAPLKQFRDAQGQPPGDGTILTLRASATDWDDYTLLKQPGYSAEVRISIRSPESLQAKLQKELAHLRPEIERAQKLLADSTSKLTTVQDGLKSKDQKANELLAPLERAEQDQRIVRGMVSDPNDGIRARAERIRTIAQANKLTNSPVYRRAESVARLLTEAEERHLSQTDGPLAKAKHALVANGLPTPQSVQDPLAQTIRQHKAAADKLAAVAEELEQWAATAEIRGDARQLRDQIAAREAEAQTLAGRLPTGATPDRLPQADRAALDRLGDELNKLSDQAGRLISKADRVAAQRRADATQARAAAEQKTREAQDALHQAQSVPPGSPERQQAMVRSAERQATASQLQEAARQAEKEATALEQAAQSAGRQAIGDALRQAAEAQRANRASNAQEKLDDTLKRLDGIVTDLDERKDPVDELVKKRKSAANQVDQLADRQDELAKKANQARQNPDASERSEQLHNLAIEQELLRRETEQLSRKLDRDGTGDGAGEAAEQLRRAAEEMERSRDELTEGRDPQSRPDDALERLEDAKKQLDQNQPQDPNQLSREQQEQFTRQFKTFLEKQQVAIVESERITQSAIKAKKWERPLQASLAALGTGQQALAKEIRQFAESKTKEVKVFDALLQQAAKQMELASSRIAERKADVLLSDPDTFDPESETAADDTVRRPMRTAYRRLEQIVQAMAEETKQKATPKAEAPNQQPPVGKPNEGSTVPPIAQLKALRNWQNEVNERTTEFAKNHPNRDKLTDDDKDELLEIELMQKEISKLLEELLPQVAMPMGGDIP